MNQEFRRDSVLFPRLPPQSSQFTPDYHVKLRFATQNHNIHASKRRYPG